MSRRDAEKIEVSVMFKRESNLAVLVNDGDKDIWLPKSQIDVEGGEFPEEGKSCELLVAEWLAKEKGLI